MTYPRMEIIRDPFGSWVTRRLSLLIQEVLTHLFVNCDVICSSLITLYIIFFFYIHFFGFINVQFFTNICFSTTNLILKFIKTYNNKEMRYDCQSSTKHETKWILAITGIVRPPTMRNTNTTLSDIKKHDMKNIKRCNWDKLTGLFVPKQFTKQIYNRQGPATTSVLQDLTWDRHITHVAGLYFFWSNHPSTDLFQYSIRKKL